jgi:hypothetical protein
MIARDISGCGSFATAAPVEALYQEQSGIVVKGPFFVTVRPRCHRAPEDRGRVATVLKMAVATAPVTGRG